MGLAIVLDRQIISAPIIKETIPNGNVTIQGNFSMKESSELALLMRSGSLPAPLKSIEEKIIGPSLGLDSIKKGRFAIIISVVSIMVFMIINYSYLGVVANI